LCEFLRALFASLVYTALVGVVGYSLFMSYQLKQQETLHKRQEVDLMRRELERVVQQNEQLKLQARFLRTEEGIEKVAREKLGLIRPNETTYVVINAPTVRDSLNSRTAMKPKCVENAAGQVQNWLTRVLQCWWNGGDGGGD